MKIKQTIPQEELRYLSLLAMHYLTVQAASREIINLQAVLSLPKGCKHFISDVHGEYEAFLHVLKSCSGGVKEKLDDMYGTSMARAEREELATLIYYPEEKLEDLKGRVLDLEEFYRITLHRLVEICSLVSARYTRSKVRKALPQDYAYIIEELLHTHREDPDKKDYFPGLRRYRRPSCLLSPLGYQGTEAGGWTSFGSCGRDATVPFLAVTV